MLQIIDISHSVRCEIQESEKQLLKITNACVSHELRNPLNAILSQNDLNNDILRELQIYSKKIRDDPKNTDRYVKNFDRLLNRLKSSTNIQV